MRYQTELMRKILTSEQAQKIIDYVSPIYGDSYVGLWIYQAIGVALDEVYKIAADLRYEANPATTERLIGYWEDSYGIPRNSNLTLEQRRERLITWRDRGPCNPHRLAAAVSSALNGVEVDIQENIAKNTFLVNIRDVVYDWTPAVQVLERKKPAHLIYEIMVALEIKGEPVDTKVAVGLTHSEQFFVQVQGINGPKRRAIGHVKVAYGVTHSEQFSVQVTEVPGIEASAIPLTNPEIDVIQEEVFASAEPMEGEIVYIVADLLPLSNEEINEVHDEVFVEIEN